MALKGLHTKVPTRYKCLFVLSASERLQALERLRLLKPKSQLTIPRQVAAGCSTS
jgi:hypothetical protein